MKRILIPTDFSSCSLNALEYALNILPFFSEKIEVILFHAYHLEWNSPDIPPEVMIDELKRLKVEAEEKLAQLCEQEVASKNKFAGCSYFISQGFASEELIKAVKLYLIDMVIMGTKGAGGLQGFFLGSVASKVITEAECPVLVVPGKYNYVPVKNILYAAAFENPDFINIKTTFELAAQLNAKLTVVHVIPENKSKSAEEDIINMWFVELAEELLDGEKINYMTKIDHSVTDGLKSIISESKADLLVMAHHKRGFIDKLLNKSRTRKMAAEIQIPLLGLQVSSLTSGNEVRLVEKEIL